MTQVELSLVVCGYLILIILLCTRRPNYVSSRALYLFRALFPSWRFFEDICEVPTLYYRLVNEDSTTTEWHPCLRQLQRSWCNLLLNPQGNLLLAYGGLLHQLENDIEEVETDKVEEFSDSVSYQLTESLVKYHLSALNLNPGQKFQFKISALLQGEHTTTQDNLISKVHSL